MLMEAKREYKTHHKYEGEGVSALVILLETVKVPPT